MKRRPKPYELFPGKRVTLSASMQSVSVSESQDVELHSGSNQVASRQEAASKNLQLQKVTVECSLLA